ncbi:MAG: glycosyltransferase [Thermoguttaceae bacterium]
MANSSKKIRLLLLIPSLDRCGAEKQLVLLAEHLPKDKFDINVVVLTRTGPYSVELERAGIPCTLINKKFKIDPFALFRLKKEIERIRPDIIHTWLFAANSYGRVAAKWCGVPHTIAAERCVDSWKSGYQFWIDRSLAKWTDRIVTNSDGVKHFYVQKGLPSDKFVVIPNAVLLSEIGTSSSTKLPPFSDEELCQQLGIESLEMAYQQDLSPGISDDYYPVRHLVYEKEQKCYLPILLDDSRRTRPFFIGVVARLWPQKRIDDLLWVFETLNHLHFHFHAVIIGDGPLREELLRMRDGWKLFNRVHFLGERKDVGRFMPRFDLLLNASGYEGQSNSILEAMSCGVPVIATDIHGNRDLVVDGKTGFLVPDSGNDFRARRRIFVEKVLQLLENEELRRQMGQHAQKRISEHFGIEQMISGYVALYSSLMQKRSEDTNDISE